MTPPSGKYKHKSLKDLKEDRSWTIFNIFMFALLMGIGAVIINLVMSI